jgi:hypothetical protein
MPMSSLVVRGRFLLLACLSALATAMIAPAAVGAAEPPITFSVTIGGDLIIVQNTANSPTNVRLRDEDGNTKAEGVLEDTDPFFELPDGVTVAIGDRIRASDGAFARTLIVPELSISVDRVADLFEGTGPAQRTIKVGYFFRFGDVFEQHGVRVRPDGTWSFAPDFDVAGGLGVAVDWKTPKGDFVHIDGSAPSVAVMFGSPRFTGNSGSPSADVEVFIENSRDGGWSGQSDAFGNFNGRFRDSNGAAVEVEAGHRVRAPSVAADLDWIVPALQIDADAATDLVSGRCAGTLAVVELYRTGHRRGFALAQGGQNGEFEFDFSSDEGLFFDPANVKRGDSLRLECILETGDSVLLRRVVVN